MLRATPGTYGPGRDVTRGLEELTGKGNDQVAITARLACESGGWERQGAGSHNTLDKLLGRAIRDAVALAWDGCY